MGGPEDKDPQCSGVIISPLGSQVLCIYRSKKTNTFEINSHEAPLGSSDAPQLSPLDFGDPRRRDSFVALVDIPGNGSSLSVYCPPGPCNSPGPCYTPQPHARPSSSLYSFPMTDFSVQWPEHTPGPSRPVSVVSTGTSTPKSLYHSSSFYKTRFFGSYDGGN